MRSTRLLMLALALFAAQAHARGGGSFASDGERAPSAVGAAEGAAAVAADAAGDKATQAASEPVDFVETDAAKKDTQAPARTEAVETAATATVAPVTALPTLSEAEVGAGGTVSEYLNKGNNPLVLGCLGAMCCVFLLLWGRKRRLVSLGGGPPGGSSGPAIVESSAEAAGTAGAVAKKLGGSKVQYSRIDDQFEAESPFRRSLDDSDDYDDELEDGFGSDRDKWDDWEPEDAAEADPNPFAASVGLQFAPPPAVAAAAPTFKLSPPPAASAPVAAAELHEVVVDAPPADSVGSNSSSDSFEVVTGESSAASPYPLFAAPTPATSVKKPEPEEKKQSVDDLFSQFGMVPTFKKGVQQQPVAVASPSSSREAGSSRPSSTAAATGAEASAGAGASSSSALPSAAEAAALFAAEMDDLGISAGGDDWGEDDEWVKGI